MFHSTINRDPETVRMQGRTFGRSKYAASRDELTDTKWIPCAAMPYETVDDIPVNSKGTRALGMSIQAAQNAHVLEIVVASKAFRTGTGIGLREDALDLPNYAMVMCDAAGLERTFADCT